MVHVSMVEEVLVLWSLNVWVALLHQVSSACFQRDCFVEGVPS